MYCGNCGKEIKDDSLFCEYCGTKVVIAQNEPNIDSFVCEKQSRPKVRWGLVITCVAVLGIASLFAFGLINTDGISASLKPQTKESPESIIDSSEKTNTNKEPVQEVGKEESQKDSKNDSQQTENSDNQGGNNTIKDQEEKAATQKAIDSNGNTSYYTITFNSNDSRNATRAVRVNFGQAYALKETILSGNGGTIIGWTDKTNNKTYEYAVDTCFNKDVTLYAIWKANQEKSSDSVFTYSYNSVLDGWVVDGLKDKNAISYIIPSSHDGKNVVGISKRAMSFWQGTLNPNNNKITIEIPDTIRSIDPDAFTGNYNVSYVMSQSNDIYSFVNGAIVRNSDQMLIAISDGSKLYVGIPDGVKNLSDNVKNINAYEVYIPDSLLDISNLTLKARCYEVNSNHPLYCSVDGVIFSKDKTELVLYPSNKEGAKYIVPNSVKTIDDESMCFLFFVKEIVIPATVEKIGNSAFRGNKFVKIVVETENKNYREENNCLVDINNNQIIATCEGLTE